MVRIGVRELRQHASRYLDLVKSGETVEVTERGSLVAVIVSPSTGDKARDRLIAAGKLLPARGPFQLPGSRRRVSGKSASEHLGESRRERLR